MAIDLNWKQSGLDEKWRWIASWQEWSIVATRFDQGPLEGRAADDLERMWDITISRSVSWGPKELSLRIGDGFHGYAREARKTAETMLEALMSALEKRSQSSLRLVPLTGTEAVVSVFKGWTFHFARYGRDVWRTSASHADLPMGFDLPGCEPSLSEAARKASDWIHRVGLSDAPLGEPS